MWRPLVKCSLQVPGSVGYLGWFKDVFHICARLTVCGQIWQCLPKAVSCQVKHWQSECEGAKRARKVIMAKLTHRLILGKAKVGNDWLVELGMSIGSPRWVVWGTTVKVRKFTSQGTCACIFFSDWKLRENFHWNTDLRCFTAPQTHRMVKVWKDSVETFLSNPTTQSRVTRVSCPGPCLDGFWKSPKLPVWKGMSYKMKQNIMWNTKKCKIFSYFK